MANAASTPRRSTISIFGGSQPQVKATSSKPGQCTHLTMTRLYTMDFQCQTCFRYGSFGWLYRCTQDREILIENDMDIGREEKVDGLCDIFPKSNDPKKRSAAARSLRLSLLNEISDQHFATYTPAQIGKLLEQRAHLLDVLAESDNGCPQMDKSSPNLPSTKSSKPQTKPWLPFKECQFKCCHTCRPTLGERSYLSLNGILNGDIPATATVGFGFHLEKRRPFSKVEHVKNLGLRPSPPARPQTPEAPTQQHIRNRKMVLRSRHYGLGIINNDREPENNTPFSFANIPSTSSEASTGNDFLTQDSSQEMTQVSELQAISTTPIRRPLPFPPARLPPPSSPATTTEDGETPLITVASQIALPEQTDEEFELTEKSLTPMEESEKDGVFGKTPLRVRGGVAVTEGAVESHVADVITQF